MFIHVVGVYAIVKESISKLEFFLKALVLRIPAMLLKFVEEIQ